MTAVIKPRINLDQRTPLQNVIPLSTPYLVFLDLSNICNSKCRWCPTGTGEARNYATPKLMTWGIYKKIIDDLCAMPEPIKTLRLYKDGEPLLNPEFGNMVSYAAISGRFGEIDTTTNGLLLGDFSKKVNLAASGLTKIFISVPQNYIYVKGYLKDIRDFYEQSSPRCKVYVKMIRDGLGEGRQKMFMKDFENISDYIYLENLAPCWPGFDVGMVGNKGIYGQTIKEVMVCPYIFYSLAINSDGSVSLCFVDWMRKLVIGNLRRESFKDIWETRLQVHRRMMLDGERKIMPVCKDCKQLIYGAPDDIDQYAQELRERIDMRRRPS